MGPLIWRIYHSTSSQCIPEIPVSDIIIIVCDIFSMTVARSFPLPLRLTLPLPLPLRCGIAMDCWMLPIHRDLLETGVQQPLLFINSFDCQWPDNVKRMMKLTRPPEHTGASPCTRSPHTQVRGSYLLLILQSLEVKFQFVQL